MLISFWRWLIFECGSHSAPVTYRRFIIGLDSSWCCWVALFSIQHKLADVGLPSFISLSFCSASPTKCLYENMACQWNSLFSLTLIFCCHISSWKFPQLAHTFSCFSWEMLACYSLWKFCQVSLRSAVTGIHRPLFTSHFTFSTFGSPNSDHCYSDSQTHLLCSLK